MGYLALDDSGDLLVTHPWEEGWLILEDTGRPTTTTWLAAENEDELTDEAGSILMLEDDSTTSARVR